MTSDDWKAAFDKAAIRISDEMLSPYRGGWRAAERRESAFDNPYPNNSHKAWAWRQGFIDWNEQHPRKS
jgi:hypothetical protein